jgi:iron complex transport system substrate-binding protein
MPERRRARLALAILLLLAALAGCGGDDDEAAGDPAADGGFPVTVDGVTIAERPRRIVSLSPTSTEILFAIGAGGQVVAVDTNSDYPEEAPDGDLDAYEPNVEAIAAKAPDLLVVSDDIEGLEALGVPVIVHPAATVLEDAYDQIEALGLATGHADGADRLIGEMRRGVEEVADGVEPADRALTYYYELDDTYYSVTSDTFVGALLAELGLESIADRAPSDAGDYPQLSAEFIVDADPDLVLLADTVCCGQDAASVAARPGWSRMRAVTGKGVVELDDDVASRWGPRVVDLLEQVAAAVERVGRSV